MAFNAQRDATARDIAIGLLVRREYSRAELAQRLKKKPLTMTLSMSVWMR